MRQDATQTDLNGILSDAQLAVIHGLCLGQTTTDVAGEAGVHRSTVHRWKTDPTFIAEMNRVRAEARAALHERLRRLQMKAADAIESALEEGDARIGLAVLRGTGILGNPLPSIGPTDPERVERALESQARSQEMLEKLSDDLTRALDR